LLAAPAQAPRPLHPNRHHTRPHTPPAQTAWLLQLSGVDFPAPKEFDDPNLVCSNILNALRALGFPAPGYAPTKLAHGYGREVCQLLDALSAHVLERSGFALQRPVHRPEAYTDGVEEADDSAQLTMADFARDMAAGGDEEEEEAYSRGGARGGEPASSSGAGGAGAGAAAATAAATDDSAARAPLVSRVDPALWKRELERVAPRLHITLASDAKDWRLHLEQAHTHHRAIADVWPASRAQLDRLRGDVTTSIDKLAARERALNEQFGGLLRQYRGARDALGGVQDSYQQLTESISDRNSELHRILQQLEEVKQTMDERGGNLSDTSPIVRIKAALKKLGEELRDMEVRIGVLSHQLLQVSLRKKQNAHARAVFNEEPSGHL
jgi:estrogen-related receptor beta like 1